MNEQLDLFQSKLKRDSGMQRALINADSKCNNWGIRAYNFLSEYIKTKKEFMAEDVRCAAFGIIPEPPSKRAWGGIIVMAKKNNLIKRKCYLSVKNPKAHRTPATLWEVI